MIRRFAGTVSSSRPSSRRKTCRPASSGSRRSTGSSSRNLHSSTRIIAASLRFPERVWRLRPSGSVVGAAGSGPAPEVPEPAAGRPPDGPATVPGQSGSARVPDVSRTCAAVFRSPSATQPPKGARVRSQRSPGSWATARARGRRHVLALRLCLPAGGAPSLLLRSCVRYRKGVSCGYPVDILWATCPAGRLHRRSPPRAPATAGRSWRALARVGPLSLATGTSALAAFCGFSRAAKRSRNAATSAPGLHGQPGQGVAHGLYRRLHGAPLHQPAPKRHPPLRCSARRPSSASRSRRLWCQRLSASRQAPCTVSGTRRRRPVLGSRGP